MSWTSEQFEIKYAEAVDIRAPSTWNLKCLMVKALIAILRELEKILRELEKH